MKNEIKTKIKSTYISKLGKGDVFTFTTNEPQFCAECIFKFRELNGNMAEFSVLQVCKKHKIDKTYKPNVHFGILHGNNVEVFIHEII